MLSGTPVGGRYEELLTQCHMLGWQIKKQTFWDNYVKYRTFDKGTSRGIMPIPIVTGYKNVDILKKKLNSYGAIFMRSDEVLDLPEQIHKTIKVKNTPEYKKFKKDLVINIEEKKLLGDTQLAEMLYLRQLAGLYNKNKYQALEDLLESTLDRLIIFYNFREEFTRIKALCLKLNKKISYVNGDGRDLQNYENDGGSVTLIQYQSGASGLNLQLANKIIYFSLTQSCLMYMQSQKRIHRIGQSQTCWYYYLITEGSIEEKIKTSLERGEDYTLELFRKDGEQ